MPEALSMSNIVNTPGSESKPKYGELKSRLQKLQDSPSFATTAAGAAKRVISSPDMPSAGRSYGSLGVPREAATGGSPPALISPMSLYTETASSSSIDRTNESANRSSQQPVAVRYSVHCSETRHASTEVPNSSKRSQEELRALHERQQPPKPANAVHQNPRHQHSQELGEYGLSRDAEELRQLSTTPPETTAVTLSQRPVTPKGIEIFRETEGLLDGLSNLPAKDQVQVLESRLRASAIMFDQMVEENMKLAKAKERAEQEKESAKEDINLAKELFRRQQVGPDVVSDESPIANRQELALMQRQMAATCQELILARRALREKEASLRDLKAEFAAEVERLEVAAKSQAAHNEEKFHKLTTEAEAYKLGVKAKLEHSESISDQHATLTHQNDLLQSQLEKAHNDLVDLKVKNAEFERLATKNSTLKQERDELKDECEDLRSSNTRMGEKIAELALLKGQLDQENASLKSTVLQNENELSNVKNSLRDKEKAVEKLEDINREQVESFTKQLQEASAALNESQAKIEELSSKYDLIKSDMKKLETEMTSVRAKNAKLSAQNRRLAVDIPNKIQTEVKLLEEQLREAKTTRDKQVRVLERRIERRDVEIFHLRSVWRALLTSHPDIDLTGEAMVTELKVLQREKLQLERQVAEECDQKETLMITVAVSYLKLVLANWRRPIYKKELAQALKESVEMEEQIEEWERYENEKELYAQQQFHTEHFRVTADVSTSSEHHQPDMLMEKMMGSSMSTRVISYSPPMTSFDHKAAAVPVTSSNYKVRRVPAPGVAPTDGSGADHATAKMPEDGQLVQLGGEGETYDAAQYSRTKALEEGRRKYAAAKTPQHLQFGHSVQHEDDTSPLVPPSQIESRMAMRSPLVSPLNEKQASNQPSSHRKLERITLEDRSIQPARPVSSPQLQSLPARDDRNRLLSPRSPKSPLEGRPLVAPGDQPSPWLENALRETWALTPRGSSSTRLPSSASNAEIAARTPNMSSYVVQQLSAGSVTQHPDTFPGGGLGWGIEGARLESRGMLEELGLNGRSVPAASGTPVPPLRTASAQKKGMRPYGNC